MTVTPPGVISSKYNVKVYIDVRKVADKSLKGQMHHFVRNTYNNTKVFIVVRKGIGDQLIDGDRIVLQMQGLGMERWLR